MRPYLVHESAQRSVGMRLGTTLHANYGIKIILWTLLYARGIYGVWALTSYFSVVMYVKYTPRA